MFEKRRAKRWHEEAEALGLTDPDGLGALGGIELDMLASSDTQDTSFNPMGTPTTFRFQTHVQRTIERSAANPTNRGPGIVAAFEIKQRSTQTGPASKQVVSHPRAQVLVARLPRPIEGHLQVVPHYTPQEMPKLEGALQTFFGSDLAPPRLAHPLLGHWWLMTASSLDARALLQDDMLGAILWSLRLKVAGAKDHVPQLSQRYEAMIAAGERHYEAASVEIHQDLIA